MKRTLRSILRFLVEWAAERSIPDINSGMRIFSKRIASRHLDHLCNTFSFTTSITLAFMMTGRFVNYKKISYANRVGVTRVNLSKDSVRTFLYICQAMVFYNPLKLFLFLAVVSLLASLLSLSAGFLFQIHSGFLMSAAFIITSVLIFVIGLLGEQLRQIFINTRSDQNDQ